MSQLNRRTKQLCLYAKLLQQLFGVCSILFELITGEKPPPVKEVLREYGNQ